PEDQPMSLAPDADAGGTLDVEVDGGAVTIRGKNCRFVWCSVEKKRKEGEKLLAEVVITVPLARWQGNWSFVEADANAALDGGGPFQEQSINDRQSPGSCSRSGLSDFLNEISLAPAMPAKSQKKSFDKDLLTNRNKKLLLLLGGG